MFWEVLFTLSLAAVFYAYFGYPISLALIVLLRGKREVRREPFFPAVTLIITAFNEEKRIKEKLKNTLRVEYPDDKLQVLVASDGSTDRTNEIVHGYGDRGIELLAFSERRGKEHAQAEAVRNARGEILVFTDVATVLEKGALREIVSNFADHSVGCVSSEDRLLGKDGQPSGEGFYVRYEMWLRSLESSVNSLVGLSGSFFAARREVCQDFSPDMQSDFRTLLNAVRMGMRGVSDARAVGYYHDISDQKQEFDRKVRTVLRGMTVFFRHLGLLNIFKYGFFSYQLFCHKLFRWLVPFFMVLALVANIIVVEASKVFLILLVGQLSFYGLGIFAWKSGAGGSRVVLKIPSYFLTVNASIALAWWRYLRGQRMVMWTPSERS